MVGSSLSTRVARVVRDLFGSAFVMPYRWVEHTGELELELESSSERGLFEAGFEAMREVLAADTEPVRIGGY